MKSIPVTKARQDLFNIVNDTIESHEPIQILGKQGGAVLVSLSDWETLQETVYLSSIKGFKESLIEVDNDPWVSEDEVNW